MTERRGAAKRQGSAKATPRKVTSERKDLDALAVDWGHRLAAFRRGTPDGSGVIVNGRERTFTQATFAARIGVPQSTVSRWESGQRMPRDRFRIAIGEALGIDPALIFTIPRPAPRRAS